MFTGIVTDIGVVTKVADHDSRQRVFTIKTSFDEKDYIPGASVACGGVCLTVMECGGGQFTVLASLETLSKTNLGKWGVGTRVNLEPSLRLGDTMGGHMVFGHVDGLAYLEDKRQEGESWRLKLRVPSGLSRYIVSKGSVSLDGVSLTINEVSGDRFGVNIIPYTWAHTTIADREPGDDLNLEIDMLARYVARISGAAE